MDDQIKGTPFNVPKDFQLEGTTYSIRMHNQRERLAIETLTRDIVPSPVKLLVKDADEIGGDRGKDLLARCYMEAQAKTQREWPPEFRTADWWKSFLTNFDAYSQLLKIALCSSPGVDLDKKEVEAICERAYANREANDAIGEILLYFLYGPRLEEENRDPKKFWRELTGEFANALNQKLIDESIWLDFINAIVASRNDTPGPVPTPSPN